MNDRSHPFAACAQHAVEKVQNRFLTHAAPRLRFLFAMGCHAMTDALLQQPLIRNWVFHEPACEHQDALNGNRSTARFR
jgi:hypothetical protein